MKRLHPLPTFVLILVLTFLPSASYAEMGAWNGTGPSDQAEKTGPDRISDLVPQICLVLLGGLSGVIYLGSYFGGKIVFSNQPTAHERALSSTREVLSSDQAEDASMIHPEIAPPESEEEWDSEGSDGEIVPR